MAQWWDQLTQQPDPNNPMSVYQAEQPGLAEIIFKLASTMGAAAPYIGGTRTAAGRALGATAALGGGVSNVMADLLRQDRLDPLQKKAQIIQAALNASNGVTIPVVPGQNVPVEGPVDQEGAFSSWGGARPTVAIPPVTRAPRNIAEFNANATPQQALQVAMGMGPGGMRVNEFFPEQKLVSIDDRVMDFTDPDRPRTLYTPEATPENKAKNYVANLLVRKRENPDDPEIDREIARYRQIHNNSETPANARYFERVAAGENSGVAWNKYLKETQDAAAGKTTAVEEAKVDVRGSQPALTATGNQAAARAGGALAVEGSPAAVDAAGRRAGATAAATVLGREGAEQQVPLNEKASQWVNPQTFEYAPANLSAKEAKDAGFVSAAPRVSAAVPSARLALRTLDRYEELAKKLLVSSERQGRDGKPIKKSQAEILAEIKANRLKLQYWSTGDPDVQEFNSLGSTIASQVKAFGDTGNIAFKEQEFHLSALPNDNDSVESALRKVQSRKKLLESVVRGSLSGSAQPRSANAPVPRQPARSGPPVAPGPRVDPEVQKYLDSFNRR